MENIVSYKEQERIEQEKLEQEEAEKQKEEQLRQEELLKKEEEENLVKKFVELSNGTAVIDVVNSNFYA